MLLGAILGPEHHSLRPQREFPFTPRIINPVKMREVILCSADENVRASQSSIRAEMPWVNVRVLTSPLAVSDVRTDGAMVLILDDVAMNLVDVERVRRNNRDLVVVLLSFIRLIHSSPPAIAQREYPYTQKADLVFAINRIEFRAEHIITSVVRAAEDHLNINKPSEVRRFILLIVDDEPSWPSQFLPVLYKIIGQRADVKITRTYEEALTFMFGVGRESEIRDDYSDFGYGDQVVCLITDVLFPKAGNVSSDAGRELIRLVNRYYIRIPIIIASKAPEATALAEKGFLLPKGDPGSLETLRNYILDRTGIGDFVIYDEFGSEWQRLKDIRGMYRLLLSARGEDPESQRLRSILEMYGQKDKFSTWFFMHGFQALGERVRPQRLTGDRMIAELVQGLKEEIVRMRQTPLVVGGARIFELQDLLNTLRSTPEDEIDHLAYSDVVSSWLDQKGYSELADALRPIHGAGPALKAAVCSVIEEHLKLYEERRESEEELPDGL